MSVIRLMIRGYLHGRLQFAQWREIEESELERVVAELGERHAAAMEASKLGMLEIEFVDEPDPEQRFFRIGVDPSGMVAPVKINLDGKE